MYPYNHKNNTLYILPRTYNATSEQIKTRLIVDRQISTIVISTILSQTKHGRPFDWRTIGIDELRATFGTLQYYAGIFQHLYTRLMIVRTSTFVGQKLCKRIPKHYNALVSSHKIFVSSYPIQIRIASRVWLDSKIYISYRCIGFVATRKYHTTRQQKQKQ